MSDPSEQSSETARWRRMIWSWLVELPRDARLAVRVLLKERRFALAATTALALGIGLNGMVFTIVNAVLLRGLPFEESDRIVAMSTLDPQGRRFRMSQQDFEDYRTFAGGVSDLTLAYCTRSPINEDEFLPEMVFSQFVSASLFGVIGEEPVLGRAFTEEDDRPGAPAVLILTDGLWKRRYAGDPAVIGQTIRASGLSHTIVGVMAEGITFPCGSEVWIPISQLPPGPAANPRDVRSFSVVGRLADGTTLSQARSELEAISEQLARDYPESNQDLRADLTLYDDSAVATDTKTLYMALMGAVGFVLLIACANVANLLLARAARRSKEVGVRLALGATRWRIVRQLLVESVLLAMFGGVVGLVVSLAGIEWFDAAMRSAAFGGPPDRPYWLTFTLDPVVFVFLAVVCLGTGVLFGIVPALQISNAKVNETLKEGGRSGTSGVRNRRWMGALIVSELALTLTLLAGAGLLTSNFLAMQRLDIGIDTSRLAMARMTLPSRDFPDDEARRGFLERVNERLNTTNAVQAATTLTHVPFAGGFSRRLEIEGRTVEAEERLPLVTMVTIGPSYFETVDLGLSGGRAFDETDGTAGREAAIVNQRLAEMYFPGENPIGQRVRLSEQIESGSPTDWTTIVGVSPNISQGLNRLTPGDATEPIVYLPVRNHPSSARFTYVLLRSETSAANLIPILRDEIRALEPDLPVYDIRRLDDLLAQSRWSERVFGSLFALFAVVALLLSAVGLYGLTEYSATQRTHEIGIRTALGAKAHEVWWLLTRRTAAQLAIGLPIGVAGAIAVGRVLQSGGFLLADPSDPKMLASVTIVLAVVALAASFVPARRATHLSPVAALRDE